MYDRGSLRFLFVFGLFGALYGYLMFSLFLHVLSFLVGGLFGIGIGMFIIWLDERTIRS